MRKPLVAWIIILSLLLMPTAGFAAALEEGVPFESSAVSLLLLEAETVQVIFEKNADEQRPVASVTKLMTIYLLLEMLEQGSIHLNDHVTVSKHAAGMGGSQALLDAGGVYGLEELLKTIIVSSANDSSVALAEFSMGSEENFVAAMNAKAQELGLTASVYKNTTGLPTEGQHTTARDIATLSRLVLAKPQYFQYSTIWMDELVHNSGRVTELVNTNRLVRFYEGADGVKTGSTNEAGYCVSASAKRGDTRFIAVVLGAKTGKERFNIAQKMLDYGFDHYGFTTLVGSEKPLAQGIPVTNAGDVLVDLYAAEPLTMLMKKGEEAAYTAQINAPESLEAPLKAGEPFGSVSIVKNGEIIHEIPLTVREDVNPSGFLINFFNILKGWPPVMAGEG